MRRFTLALAVVAIVVLSGCLGSVIPEEISERSEPAVVSDDVLAETGYERDAPERVNLTEDITVRNTTIAVDLTNWQTHHGKSAGPRDMSVFTVFSTPEISIMGISTNPLGKIGFGTLVEHTGGASGIESLERVNTSAEVTMFNETVAVEEYTATVERYGETQDVHVYMARGSHDGDYILAMGFHPAAVDESENIFALMEGLEHGEHLRPTAEE